MSASSPTNSAADQSASERNYRVWLRFPSRRMTYCQSADRAIQALRDLRPPLLAVHQVGLLVQSRYQRRRGSIPAGEVS